MNFLACGNGEGPNEITSPSGSWRNEVRKRGVELPFGFFHLLTQTMQDFQRATIRIEKLDILTSADRLPESHHATRMEKLLGYNLIKESAGIIIEFAGLDADLGIVEKARKTPTQFPSMKKR